MASSHFDIDFFFLNARDEEADQNEKYPVAIKMNGPTFLALLKMIFHLSDAFDSSPEQNKASSKFPENQHVVKPGNYREKSLMMRFPVHVSRCRKHFPRSLMTQPTG